MEDLLDLDMSTKSKSKIDESVQLPTLYNVVFLNDDVTPAVFVIECLCNIFQLEFEEAEHLTNLVDSTGSAVVVTGISLDIAEHLRSLVMSEAKKNNYPFQAKVLPQ